MVLLASIALTLLALHGLCLFVWCCRFLRLFSQPEPEQARSYPRAAVLLPVRGADPHLADCLRGLLNQDYPDYAVWIIVDSPRDDAWQVISGMTPNRPGVEVHTDILKEPSGACSLKISALLQALAQLDAGCEIVALIDADVIPHPGWLRDLAGPLGQPGIGASTGIRWYAPASRSWGSLVRYLWNAAAALHMTALHIPWGGSLAMRVDVLRRSGLLEQWSHSVFEDTACFDALRRFGLAIHFVPAALMVNRESVRMKGCFHFIRRQLLDVRLYHSRWWIVLGLGLVSTLALGMTAALALAAGIQGDVLPAFVLGGSLPAYWLIETLLLFWIERRLSHHRLAPAPRQAILDLCVASMWAIPLTQVVYGCALIATLLTRRIGWRGIDYEFDGPWSVRMIEYRPLAPPEFRGHGDSVT